MTLPAQLAGAMTAEQEEILRAGVSNLDAGVLLVDKALGELARKQAEYQARRDELLTAINHIKAQLGVRNVQ